MSEHGIIVIILGLFTIVHFAFIMCALERIEKLVRSLADARP